jgi:deazaflavin-dependent oxidoreductase (nitroreductase family)
MENFMNELERQVATVERLAFSTLNAFVEPLVRAGVGGPLLLPFGAIVLETTGRKSGELRRTPLLASVAGQALVVATFRADRSNWMKNLKVNPRAAWWASGNRASGTASIFAGDAWPEASAIPAEFRTCAETSWRALANLGWAVAVLEPDRS